jgi:hypothetical protein
MTPSIREKRDRCSAYQPSWIAIAVRMAVPATATNISWATMSTSANPNSRPARAHGNSNNIVPHAITSKTVSIASFFAGTAWFLRKGGTDHNADAQAFPMLSDAPEEKRLAAFGSCDGDAIFSRECPAPFLIQCRCQLQSQSDFRTSAGPRRARLRGAQFCTWHVVPAVGGVVECQAQEQKMANAVAAYEPSPNGPQACRNRADFIAPQ